MIIKQEMPFHQEKRTLHIYLPDNYYQTQERYPVMYYFDGHNLFYDHEATYGKSWGLKDFLDHYGKHFIIVGMECNHQGNGRLVEYSPYHLKGKFWGDIHGTGKDTMEWIVHDIKPMIDQQYRTYAHREATGIAGSSMGGLMSLYAIIKYNAIFSKAACLSSAITSCMKDLQKDYAHSEIQEDTRVYLSYGERELKFSKRYPLVNQTVQDWFRQKKARCLIYVQKEGEHNEACWEKQNEIYMKFLWD